MKRLIPNKPIRISEQDMAKAIGVPTDVLENIANVLISLRPEDSVNLGKVCMTKKSNNCIEVVLPRPIQSQVIYRELMDAIDSH